MTYDSARHRTLMFGGYDGRFPLNETWQWDGMDWTQIQVAGPSARVETAIAFDSVRNVAVLFAGRDFSLPGYMQDTWEWNGTAWTQRFPAHVPPARSHHAMAFDPDRAMTVMFGGVSNQGFPADVWEWDGADWLQRTSSGGPGPRQSTALTYDPSLGGVILFGGDSGSTWRWDGAAWHQLLPPQSPYPRLGNSMVADFARRRIVLLGSDPTPDPFAWEWDGATWQTRFVTSPGPRSYLGLAYDSSRRETVLFGGDSLVADTWVYATPNPASSTSYGSGCPGSIGTPLLANARYSLPWIGDSFTMEVTNLAPATSVAILATGIFSTLPQSLAIFGMPGCDAFLVPAATQFVV
ncbi:MAG TPA: hypothetical protein VK348_11335, partial [Planctomycetota bacterium]|nr:hypothetical protein [Planctomycetota bacterium]